MNFETLMRTCWKEGAELPSDTLLRENPAAYDSSPMPVTKSAIEFSRAWKKPSGGKLRTEQKKRVLEKLIARDGLACCWCGFLCDATSRTSNIAPTIDHLTRIADGGRHQLTNLKIACRQCNSSRHSRNWPNILAAIKKNRARIRFKCALPPENKS